MRRRAAPRAALAGSGRPGPHAQLLGPGFLRVGVSPCRTRRGTRRQSAIHRPAQCAVRRQPHGQHQCARAQTGHPACAGDTSLRSAHVVCGACQLGLTGTAAAWYFVLSRHLVRSGVAAFLGGAFCGFLPRWFPIPPPTRISRPVPDPVHRAGPCCGFASRARCCARESCWRRSSSGKCSSTRRCSSRLWRSR
jgi:hypothetical protein